MSRSRSASVSGASPFAPPPTSNDLSASADILSALSLEGRDVKASSRAGTPSPLVWRSSSSQTTATIVQQAQETVVLTLKEAVEPRVLDVRPPCRVRRAGAPRFHSSPGSTASSSAQGRSDGLQVNKGDGSNGRSLRAATLSPLSISGGGGKAEPEARGAQHPFDEPRFAGGLMAAGYLEMFDISRKKIKTRFSHGLGKENFKDHLTTFLDTKDLKSRGEYMIRFVGQQDVHSPFVHIYTTTLLLDTSTVKTIPPTLGASDTLTTWTHLRTINNASHWSAKKPKFWPLRVVLEGPSSTDIVPSADEPPSPIPRSRSSKKGRRDDDEDILSPATEQNTKANSAFVNHPKREVIEPSSPPRPRLTLPIPPPSTTPASAVPPAPTILASVRQLGVAVVSSIPPNVQTAVQSQVAALKSWMGKKGEGEEEEDEEQRRERRRARRQARREREELERMPSRRERERVRERSRSRERETIESREDREARREEKERRREERRARG